MLATYLIAWWITRSRFGRLLVALRDDEDRVRFTGYNVALIKAVVFGDLRRDGRAWPARCSCRRSASSRPPTWRIVPSIEMVIWVAVGGRGTLVGRRRRRGGGRLGAQLPQRGVPGHLAVLPRRAVHRRGRPVPERHRRHAARGLGVAQARRLSGRRDAGCAVGTTPQQGDVAGEYGGGDAPSD